MSADWRPSARLRWVPRDGARVHKSLPNIVLQVWWGPDLPSYMADARVGEWRDVPTVEAAP